MYWSLIKTPLGVRKKGVIDMKQALEKWAPFGELNDWNDRMNRLFTRTGWDGGRELLTTADWMPSCNVSEDDKEFRIRVELPDVRKEDVQVKLENGTLIIEGERKEEKEEKGVKVHRREMSYGKFIRRFTMLDEVDASKIKATYDNGILMVTIPKSRIGQPHARQIPIS
jgi:HSP20 family protein